MEKQYTITKWKYSDTHAESRFKDPVPGLAYLKITSAVQDDDKGTYRLIVDDLSNDLSMSLTYFMDSYDRETDKITPNNMAIGTLETLGTALFGQNVGVPYPDDVIGGVVHAEVKLSSGKPDAEGKVRQWPRVYKFEAVEQEIADTFSDIDQYCVEDGQQ